MYTAFVKGSRERGIRTFAENNRWYTVYGPGHRNAMTPTEFRSWVNDPRNAAEVERLEGVGVFWRDMTADEYAREELLKQGVTV